MICRRCKMKKIGRTGLLLCILSVLFCLTVCGKQTAPRVKQVEAVWNASTKVGLLSQLQVVKSGFFAEDVRFACKNARFQRKT